jgi:hypothetical protein
MFSLLISDPAIFGKCSLEFSLFQLKHLGIGIFIDIFRGRFFKEFYQPGKNRFLLAGFK